MDEKKQVFLFFGEHGVRLRPFLASRAWRAETLTTDVARRSVQIVYVPYTFSSRSASHPRLIMRMHRAMRPRKHTRRRARIVEIRTTPRIADPKSNSEAGRKSRDGKRRSRLFIEPSIHSFAVGAGQRWIMRGLFSQIIIGVIVTVVGTLITDAVTGGHVGRHFAHGYHASSRGK
jgi:hypothetical protein